MLSRSVTVCHAISGRSSHQCGIFFDEIPSPTMTFRQCIRFYRASEMHANIGVISILKLFVVMDPQGLQETYLKFRKPPGYPAHVPVWHNALLIGFLMFEWCPFHVCTIIRHQPWCSVKRGQFWCVSLYICFGAWAAHEFLQTCGVDSCLHCCLQRFTSQQT